MRIAIDARAYFQRTGIARYTRGLVHALVEAAGRHQFLLLISGQHVPVDVPVDDPRVEIRVSRAPWLGGEEESQRIAQEVARWGADLFHSIFPPLAVADVPSIVTIFDLTPLSHPHLHQPAVVSSFQTAVGRAVDDAARIVAISQATADAVRRCFPLAHARTRVSGVGLAAPFLETVPRASRRAGMLFVGTIEPRKNVHVIVDVARRLRAGGYCGPVTIAGKNGWGNFDVTRELAGVTNARYQGYVDDLVLRTLYRRAAVFLYPSTVEGFGLPVLEAMSQGAVPLISADPALCEVVRDPALVVDMNDPDAIADAVVRWSADSPKRLGKAGRLLQKARCHTWPRAARRVADVYGELQ
jgi:glycosyltransferase involved in cell wall biosynthesis